MFLAPFALIAFQGGLLPSFPEAWPRLNVVSEKRDGGTVAQIAPAGGDGFSATGAWIQNPPLERELRFSVWLRAVESGSAAINAFAYGEGQKLIRPFTVTVAVEAGKWVEGRSTIVAPPGTKELRLFVINTASKPLDVSSPRLELGEAKIVSLHGSGLLRASAASPVTGGKGTLLFPIPGPTAESVPVSFVLRSTPPEALEGYTVRRRAGDNWICEARVSPPAGGTATLRWEALVAVRDGAAKTLPKAKFGPVAPTLASWLTSTPVVQAADPAIRAKAAALRKASPDVETFARKVIEFTSQNEGKGKPHTALDAASAMEQGGSCTNRANLAAALLRAGGVPARTVSHLPVWAYGSPLYEHWLTEYWHPGVGWTRVETTLGRFRPQASSFAPLATASIEDERMTGKPGQIGWIMPGAAWMSGVQGTGALRAGNGSEGAAAWCRPERKLVVDAALLKAAREAWPRLAIGHPELDATAMTATPEELIQSLVTLGQ